MARLLRTARRAVFGSSPSYSHHLSPRNPTCSLQQRSNSSECFSQSRQFPTKILRKSLFEANILRILRNEIDYQSEYAPPHQPATKFNEYVVQDRPGEQRIMMRRKYGDNEQIKIEATMFDGCKYVPKSGDDSTGVDMQLHLSLLVDISKEQGPAELEFACSAWPHSLEIHKVYLLKGDKMTGRPYIGPDFRKLNGKLQKTLREFLEARGVNDELSVFLHEYMMNKDRLELIRWLRNVESFVEY